MRASMVIPAHNEGDFLWKTVRSCLETTEGLDADLVVADDASSDGSIEELLRRYPGIPVVSHPRRRGVSPTKDLGARNSRGEVLVFIDGHSKPDVGAIERLVADVEELEGQTVVTPAVPSLDTLRWQIDRRSVGFGFGFRLPSFQCRWVGRKDLRRQGRFYESPALVGCCLAVSRALYERLWGFDPHMLQYGMEDIDFGLKAWLMGHSVLNDPQALIAHRFRTRFDNFSVEEEHPLVNNLRTARKHFGDRTWALWIEDFRSRRPKDVWERAWDLYSQGLESLEREREYLQGNRVRGEYWYGGWFHLGWPPLPKGGN